MGIGAAIASTVIGSAVQAKGAKDAASAQTAAANAQMEEQRQAREQMRADLAPFRDGGNLGFQAYLSEMGLGPAPMIGGTAPAIEEVMIGGSQGGMRQGGGGAMVPVAGSGGQMGFRVNGRDFATREEAEAYANANRVGGQQFGGFQQSQDYLFGLNQGLDAVQSSAAARGGLYSGATLRDLNTFGQNFASQRRGDWLNRLAGIGDAGQSAAAMSGNASMAGAAGISNALSNLGNAQASGAIGRGNAINSGINNVLSLMSYQNMFRPQGNTGTGSLGLPRPF